MPKDKITGLHQGFAFTEFETVEDAEYCIRILNNIKLFGRHLKINRASQDRNGEEEFNAKLFIGNLDMEVDEKTLFDHFSQFGPVLSAKVMTELDSDKSRGFGFVTMASFDDSDRAIEAMNGQYLAARPINVGYAFKKDSKTERHGSKAERELAAKSQQHRARLPSASLIAGNSTMAPVMTPTYMGGRAGAAVSNMSQPPPPMQPPPPPVPTHLQHHPSRAIPQYGGPPPPPFMHQPPPFQQQPPPQYPPAWNGPQGGQFGAPPPPPPQFQQYPPQFHQPPPPPPQFYGGGPPPGQFGAPPPPQFHPYPPPQPQFHQPPPPPQFYGGPPPPGQFGAPPPPPPGQFGPPPGQFA